MNGAAGFGSGSGVQVNLTSAGSRVRPAGGWELRLWLFMRASGMLLVFLALGHLFIMHVFNSIHSIDYQFVVERYAKVFWRAYDGLMLWLALLHGMNGLRVIVDDYLRGAVRVWAVRALYGVMILLLALGSWVVIAFEPMKMAGG